MLLLDGVVSRVYTTATTGGVDMCVCIQDLDFTPVVLSICCTVVFSMSHTQE